MISESPVVQPRATGQVTCCGATGATAEAPDEPARTERRGHTWVVISDILRSSPAQLSPAPYRLPAAMYRHSRILRCRIL